MAVHLNARLNTRFIPVLFTVAALLCLGGTLAHASAESDGARPLPLASPADAPLATAEELSAVMSEGVDSARLDRRPGLGEITVAPRPGEHPSTGSLSARQDVNQGAHLGAHQSEEPGPVMGPGSSGNYLDFSDSVPAQPAEAAPDSR